METAPTLLSLPALAVKTGLRAAELRSLTRGSFDFAGDEPSVTIAAAYAKNRRQDVLPLRPDFAALLEKHLAGKMPSTPAFAVPHRTDVIRMFRADMADARREWIADEKTPANRDERVKSTFLSDKDDSGRWVDFHALRHTFITGLVTGGVNPKVAQTLARHSVITLTMDRYTHLYAGDLASALNVLPDLSAPARQTTAATGTDGKSQESRLSPDLSPGSEFQRSSMQSGGAKSDHVRSREIREIPAESPIFPGNSEFRRSGRVVDCAGLENR